MVEVSKNSFTVPMFWLAKEALCAQGLTIYVTMNIIIKLSSTSENCHPMAIFKPSFQVLLVSIHVNIEPGASLGPDYILVF